MAVREPKVVRFGNFELDQRTCELRKHGLKIKLQQKPLQVLSILLERRGEVVSREELQRSLWPDGVFVDFDHSLNTAIKKLRDALGDTAATPRYVATVDRKGYRFAADAQEIAFGGAIGTPAHEAAASSSAADPVTIPEVKHLFIQRYRWLLAVAILVLTAAGSYARWKFSGHAEAPVTRRIMLAVLPFTNLTGDSAQDYFSDGLTEETLTQLGNLDPQHLGVIARTSVMHYKGSQAPLDQIGRELGVQYVVEGSVRRDAGRVRISAQLIQVKDQSNVWARQYDRELKSLLTLQGEIAQEIAYQIQLTLGDQSGMGAVQRPVSAPSSYEAYDLYLQGLYFWNKRTEKGFDQAEDYFQQAIAKDPTYARAYAGLANTYALKSTWFEGSPNELMPKARRAALKALQLDGAEAEAHTALALIAESYDYKWRTAEEEFRRAIELDPNYATAHQWYAEYLSWQGRFDDAFIESEHARKLDPLSLIVASDHGDILFRARQYDRAITEYRVVLGMDPSFVHTCGLMARAYAQQRRFTEALTEINQCIRPRNEAWASAEEARVFGQSGRSNDAEQALAKFEELDRSNSAARSTLALDVYVATGRKDQAVALLQKLYAEHSNVIPTLKSDPSLDPLRSDPRFQDMLHRVGLD